MALVGRGAGSEQLGKDHDLDVPLCDEEAAEEFGSLPLDKIERSAINTYKVKLLDRPARER